MTNKTSQQQTSTLAAAAQAQAVAPSQAPVPRVLEIPDVLMVKDLAAMIGVVPIDVIKQLMRRGLMLAINDVVDQASAATKRRGSLALLGEGMAVRQAIDFRRRCGSVG